MCADCVGDGICVVTQMVVDLLCINMPIGDIGCVAVLNIIESNFFALD